MKNLKKLQHSKFPAVPPYFLLPIISSHFLPFFLTSCRRFTRTFLQLLLSFTRYGRPHYHLSTCTLFIFNTKLVSLLAVIVFSIKVLPVPLRCGTRAVLDL